VHHRSCHRANAHFATGLDQYTSNAQTEAFKEQKFNRAIVRERRAAKRVSFNSSAPAERF